jgi:hypothetical protein
MKHNYDNTLPSDIRTLLKTPRYHNIIKIDPGEYIHCGIKLSLDKVIKDLNIKPSVSLDVDYFIDGLQISRSSRRGLWIILGRVHKLSSPFIVGIYIGYKKPKNFNEFLTPFVNEIKSLTENYIHEGTKYIYRTNLIIADIPAHASLAGKY